MARFAGKVQGVVVQIRTKTFFVFNAGNFLERSEIIGNFT